MATLQRQPTHVGEILKVEFLVPLGITQSHLAKALPCPRIAEPKVAV